MSILLLRRMTILQIALATTCFGSAMAVAEPAEHSKASNVAFVKPENAVPLQNGRPLISRKQARAIMQSPLFPATDCKPETTADERLCDGGNGDACARAGWSLWLEPEQQGKAQGILARGCDLGSGESCKTLASLVDMDGPKTSPYWRRAAVLLQDACSERDPDACEELANLGSIIPIARPVSEVRDFANRIYVARCVEGDGSACWMAGSRALLEKGGKEEAHRLLGLGCTSGDSASCSHMVLASLEARAPTAAHHYAQLGCKTGDPIACYRVARGELVGLGTKRNLSAAINSFRQMCERGFSDGCANAAVLLEGRDSRSESEVRQLWGVACASACENPKPSWIKRCEAK